MSVLILSRRSVSLCLSLLAALCVMSSAPVAFATGYSVAGQLDVFKKGGIKPLRHFDNAVLYLTRQGKALKTTAPAKAIAVNQTKKQFVPRLLPVVKGQLVHFYNRDRVDHNVFSSDEHNEFDLGRYPKDSFEPQRFNQLGLQKIYCNIHKAMILDVMVLGNHYFSLTDREGNFNIHNVPAGQYQLHAWHIYGGESVLDLEVKEDVFIDDLVVTSLRVVRELSQHLDKEGKAYRKLKAGYRR